MCSSLFFFFFFNDTATTEIYTLSLHDALPIYVVVVHVAHAHVREVVARPGRGVFREVDGVAELTAALHGEASGVRAWDQRRGVPDGDSFLRLDDYAKESVRREDEVDLRSAPVADGVHEHRIHARRVPIRVFPAEAIGDHGQRDVGVEGHPLVHGLAGRPRRVELLRLFHLHADAGIALLGETRNGPAGLNVAVGIALPALRVTDHRHDVPFLAEYPERQRYHDRPLVELIVPLEESLDGQRGIDRLLRGRGRRGADEESECERRFAHPPILCSIPPVR